MKNHQKQEIEQTSTKTNPVLKFQCKEKNKTSNKLEIPKKQTKKKNKANDRKETIELEKLKRRKKRNKCASKNQPERHQKETSVNKHKKTKKDYTRKPQKRPNYLK